MTRPRHTHDHRESLVSDETGAVYVEFLLAFLPVFTMFLGMLQAGLLYGANLVVTHSANRAARAAVVVLDAPESDFDDDPRMTIDYGDSSGSTDAICQLLNVLSVPCSFTGGEGNARLSAIRAAASFPLLSIAPSLDQQLQDRQVLRAVGGDPMMGRALNGLLYNRGAVSVTFPDHPEREFTVAQDENLKVRVTYLFHCGIPIAARYMCDDPKTMPALGGFLSFPTLQDRELIGLFGRRGLTAAEVEAHRERVRITDARLDRARQATPDLLKVSNPAILAGLAFGGGRYTILQAESAMVVHSAEYEYSE
jgi:hypothetical protein